MGIKVVDFANIKFKCNQLIKGDVAQSVRALPSQGRGRGLQPSHPEEKYYDYSI